MADATQEGLLTPFLRRRRFAAAAPFVHGRVLDFGCGIGLLADRVAPGQYLGIDRDPKCLEIARARCPAHKFEPELPQDTAFDTVVSLAVIEHVPDPGGLIEKFSRLLAAEGRIVLTTPHPLFDGVYGAGARIGLFSRAASEEHETLIAHAQIDTMARAAGLRVEHARRFLFGANQLFVLVRERLQ